MMNLGILFVLVIGAIRGSEAEYKRVCYYTNWSQYRTGDGKYMPSDIPTDLCTHVIYAFAKLQGTSLTTLEANDKQLYQQVTGLKSSNPAMKAMLAVGGWTAGSAPFSSMARTQTGRASFIQSAIQFLRANNFDGLDIDWEYPGARGGTAADKGNMASLLKEMKAAFAAEAATSGKEKLLISVAVPAGKSNIDGGYDVRSVGQSVDFINLMAYDLHGSWDGKTGANAPLHAGSGGDPTLTVEYAANYWASQGAPKDKIIVGMPTYGQTFRVSGGPSTPMGAPSSGPGAAGPYTKQAGFLAYHEICKMQESGGTDHWDSAQHVPYYVNGQTWVGYDNVKSITEKAQWVKQNGFGGGMIWALDSDDFKQVCSSSTRTYPLLRAIKDVLGGGAPPAVVSTSTMRPTTTLAPWQITKSTTLAPWQITKSTTLAPWQITKSTTLAPWQITKSTTLSPWQTTKATTAQPVRTDPTWKPWTPAPTTQQKPWTPAPTTQQPWTQPPTTQHPASLVTNHQSTEFSCKSRSDGYYTGPASCTVFYRCVSGNAVHFSCTTGTQYNPTLHECDWPYNVNCTPGQ